MENVLVVVVVLLPFSAAVVAIGNHRKQRADAIKSAKEREAAERFAEQEALMEAHRKARGPCSNMWKVREENHDA